MESRSAGAAARNPIRRIVRVPNPITRKLWKGFALLTDQNPLYL